MALKATFDIKGIESTMASIKAVTASELVSKLAKIGAECIDIARNSGNVYTNIDKVELEALRHRPHQPNYIDNTYRLRKSLGYLVAYDGVVMAEDFTSDEGSACAMEVLAKNNSGIILIMVAGADYAVKLTFEKGYDVLDSASIEARRQFLEYAENLN